jgi:hypothetical protein
MSKRRTFILIVSILLFSTLVRAQDSVILKVHFLYGSKPVKQHRATEGKWFGGMKGGHVGLEVNSDEIFSFVPVGKFHVFASKTDFHSRFTLHSVNEFYGLFGGYPDSMKKAVVHIPISKEQKRLLDSIADQYKRRTPYDYALIGIRCAGAADDILAQLGILPQSSRSGIVVRSFYPKLIRRRLIRLAMRNEWQIVNSSGSTKRKWERD